MSLSSRKTTVERLLKSKEYRDAYVLEHIKNGVAFQIRTLREDRDWTQGDLGDAMGKPRNVISRIEDPNYREYEDVSPARLSAHSITSTEEFAALSEWAKEERIVGSLADAPSASKVVMLSDWATRYSRVADDIATSAKSACESSTMESQQQQFRYSRRRSH